MGEGGYFHNHHLRGGYENTYLQLRNLIGQTVTAMVQAMKKFNACITKGGADALLRVVLMHY